MNAVILNDPMTGASARIAPDLGFNCYEFLAVVGGQRISIIDSAEGFGSGGKPPSHSGIPILFPFPNRIRSGKYSWDGVDYELPESLVGYEGSGNAIHGFCLDRPWRVIGQTDSSVTAVFRISKDAPERLPLWPSDALFQKWGVGGISQQLTVMVALQQQCVTVLQRLHHMRTAVAEIGEDAHVMRSIGATQLQWFAGIMGHGKWSDLQAAHFEYLAVTGNMAL